MKEELKNGDRIKWDYEHFLNSRSSTWITKRGIFLRSKGEKAVVHFDGNKTNSTVLLASLTPLIEK